ncbi:MAG: MarC family protein, partial [Candidatus Omnitrophota bacterium]
MNRKTSLQRSLFPRFSLKAISLFTVIVFLCSDFLSFPGQALAQTSPSSHILGGTDAGLLASASAIGGKVQELVIPPELGSIQSFYQGHSGKMTICIQDAHAVPDAQRSLMKLIEYFQSKYGVRQVALEGAEGKLDPELFRDFPDKEKLSKVFNGYLDSGELSGAAAASVLLPRPMDYVGMEDWNLYQEGVTAFLDGLGKQADLKSQLSNLKAELRKLKDKYYGPKAMEFDARYESWRQKQGDLAGFLSYLAKVPGLDKKSYPSLDAVIQGLLNENVPDNSKLDQELKVFTAKVQAALKGKTLEGKLNELRQSVQTGRVGKVEFACEVKKLVPGSVFEVSQELQSAIESHERIVRLQGSEFVAEFEKAVAEIKGKISHSLQEKEIQKLSEQVGLLEKLLSFELSRSEWEQLRDSSRVAPATEEDIQRLKESIASVYSKTEVFWKFYKLALKRESVFVKNIRKLLSRPTTNSDLKSAVVVMGGFHSSGVSARLKEQDVSYVVVSPKINEVPQDDRYLAHMKGKVSWRKYFNRRNGKIDLYDAFVRATVEKLLGDGKLNPKPYSLNAKEWRDEVIRTLAASGRVAEHAKYTNFIDQQAVENSGEYQALKEKWTAKLERFIGKLHFLGKNNQLTQTRIAKLLSQPANQTPYAAASLTPGNLLSVSLDGAGVSRATEKLPPQEISIPSLARLIPSVRSEVIPNRESVAVEAMEGADAQGGKARSELRPLLKKIVAIIVVGGLLAGAAFLSDHFLKIFLTIFFVVNPIGSAVTFVSMTGGLKDAAERKNLSKKSLVAATAVGALFLFAGNLLFDFMGITLTTLMILRGQFGWPVVIS